MSDNFAAIARRMAELNLQRDRPFAEKPAPDWEAELSAKLQPRSEDDVQWAGGC